ncbi:hypothetical protein DPMN_037030 [Dreissena polymorpha]|uniref:Uncharacterized protein n=1 Tax=Dreissena polymorpha TaxID=45954 RepID=A0A9D4MCQ1_DREPO|nr:hypothetical protein DPMN_037030 [Dreissena polymorpha]
MSIREAFRDVMRPLDLPEIAESRLSPARISSTVLPVCALSVLVFERVVVGLKEIMTALQKVTNTLSVERNLKQLFHRNTLMNTVITGAIFNIISMKMDDSQRLVRQSTHTRNAQFVLIADGQTHLCG